MVIDFSTINYTDEQPVLILQNADGTSLQTLGYAFNLEAELCYNEISTITFDLPAYVDGVKTPKYDDVVGSRIIDMVGWGRFILTDPSRDNDGAKEIKKCKAYSLEHELTYKKMSLEENTYNFWNPAAPDETIMGIIISYLPSWRIGSVDSTLVGKYRTFSEDNVNIYNFIKSTVQQTYGCIFEFDTYERKINVKDASGFTETRPVFLSLENLSKSISIDEDTENIFTVLDVNGADGVTIRSVNPLGTNKIYNLDYYIGIGAIPENIAEKWNEWKVEFEAHQLPYFNLTIENMLKTAAITTEENLLSEMQGEDLAVLENKQAVTIEYLAKLSDKDSELYRKYQQELDKVNADIASKESEISAQREYIDSLKTEKAAIMEEIISINKATAFSNFFSPDELVILDRYFKEDSIEESSFVISAVDTYVDAGVSSTIGNTTYTFTGGNVQKVTTESGKNIYTIRGGNISSNAEASFNANIISASVEFKDDGSFVLSGYLGSGTLNTSGFPSGCISVTGECDSVTSDVIPDGELGDAYLIGTSLSFYIKTGRLYFTKNTTEYEQFSVEWDLYEYGKECLDKLSYPSFSFSVDTGNFFAIDDFELFSNNLALGKKVYLDLDGERPLEPILVKASFRFEEIGYLKLEFGDTYNLSDSAFSLVDLLDKSIAMGKTVDTSRFGYNAFIDSGASTTVKNFMDSALDVSKNNILSSSGIDISWGSGGIRARKKNENGTGFEPEQIAIINNSIVFTDDGWSTANMAIGHFNDTNLGDVWGVIAPNIVGTLLAGNNLVIESQKKDGGISVFRVDADGAVLHNARFDIENGVSHIMLDPTLGFAIGSYPVLTQDEDGNDIWHEDNAKFWVDTEGNIHFKGHLEGATGSFSGTIKGGDINIGNGNFVVDADGNLTAKSGTFSGTISGAKYFDSKGNNMMTNDEKFSSDYLSLYGIEITDGSNTTFSVSADGSIYMNGQVTLSAGSYIDWEGLGADCLSKDPAYKLAQSAASDASNAASAVSSLANGRYKGTFISNDKIISPFIMGAHFYATGEGRLSQPAYYIYDQYDQYKDELGQLKGYISYDRSAPIADSDAATRVLFNTEDGVALKLNAGGNMSLKAARYVYIDALLNLAQGIKIGADSYGSTPPTHEAEVGQLYFVIT